jgi:hypothetical protein
MHEVAEALETVTEQHVHERATAPEKGVNDEH